MDDFDFIEDDILDDEIDDDIDFVLDDEFLDKHFHIVPDSVIENFPFIEDDVEAITDYQLFSKGFGYLDEKKADKTEIPDVSNFVTKNVDDLTYYTKTSDLSEVALTGDYTDLSNKPTIPTKTSDLNNDSGYITKDVNDLTNYPLTSTLSSVAFSGDYDDLVDKPTIPDVSNFITKDVNDLTYYTLSSNLSSVATSGSYNDLSNKPTIPPTMTILSYGNSSWNDFINAYNSNTIVYCRASSNSNPATGNQTRLGFMAYVNNATSPTEVEFQYYRSVSSHSDSQQGDQVFVYKLTSAGTWTVTTRDAFSKIVAGTNLSSSYSNGVLTLNNTLTVPTKTSDLNNDSGFITKSVNDLTNYTNTTTLTSLLSNKENVIETGSNTYGYWIKLSNGVLIQYGSIDISGLVVNNAYGGIYYNLTSAYTLPKTFTTRINCVATFKTNGVGNVCINNFTNSSISFKVYNGDDSSNISGSISWIAIGTISS